MRAGRFHFPAVHGHSATATPALRIARQELDGWAPVFATRERSAPTIVGLEGLPAVPLEHETRHVATAVAVRRGRARDEVRVVARAPQRPQRRMQSARLLRR